MNKPIYTVYALVDGKSVAVGNATDKLSEAQSIAQEYFVSHGKKLPVKIVSSVVTHSVVNCYKPKSIKIRVVANSKIHWCYSKKEFNTLVSDFLLNKIPFQVYAFEYDY